MTTTLVTGANGFIGSRLLSSNPRRMVRRLTGLPEEVEGDLLNPASLMDACKGMDRVFHCAGYAHAPNTQRTGDHWRTNYEGTCNLLNAAGQAGVKNFVFLSSVRAMAHPGENCVDEEWPGEPATADGIAKRAAENAVLEAGRRYGMHVVNLRLAMVYGNGGRGNLERLGRALARHWMPILPETGNRRSLVHVDDVARAIRIAAESPQANGQTYIVAHPQSYSTRQLCDAILDTMPDSSGTRWRVPETILRMGAKFGDIGQLILRRNLPINSTIVSRLLDSECYSSARITEHLGWRAQVDLIDGIREMLSSESKPL